MPNIQDTVQSAVSLDYADCISLDEWDPSPMVVLDMTLSQLIDRIDFWEMWSTLLLSLLPGPLWCGVGVPDKLQFMS